jgi:hypothetical protein
MLCKIITTGDQKSQEIQLIKAIRAVATAAAGSTPSAVCSTVYNNASSSPYEVITVLDNTTAGGWSVHADGTNLRNAVEAGTYTEFLQLYSTTGKSSLPYAWIKFISSYTQPTVAPQAIFCFWGFSAATNNLTGDGNNIANHHSSSDSTNSGTVAIGSNGVGAPDNYRPMTFGNASQRTYYIGCNSEYIHIQQGTAPSDGYYSSGAFIHFGTRTNSTWEDAYSDNPYWVGLYGSQGTGTSVNAIQGYFTKMRCREVATGSTEGVTRKIQRGLYNTATEVAPIYFNMTSSYYNLGVGYGIYTNNALSSWYPNVLAQMNSTYSAANQAASSTNNSVAMTTIPLQGPIINPCALNGAVVHNAFLVSDEISGALLPDAQPVRIAVGNNRSGGGIMKNLFQSSVFFNEAGLFLYHTLDAPVNINGQTYVGLRHGESVSNTADAARQLLYVKTS